MRRTNLRTWLNPAILLLIPTVAFGACGSGEKSDETERVEECDAYAKAYQRCLTRLGHSAEGAERANAMTARFAAPRDEDARADLKRRCTAGIQRLEASCR
jgi:hypothetical protein